MSQDRSFIAALSLAVLGSLAATSTASAQSSWTSNASGNWSSASNWSGGVVPIAGPTQQLEFSFTTPTEAALTLTNDVADPYVLNSMAVISNTTSSITLNGGALQFTGPDATLRSTMTQTTNVFMNNVIQFGSQGLTIISSTVGTGPANSSQFIVNGAISTNNSGLTTLTLDGSATAGANRLTGVISDGVNGGSVGIFKQGTGNWSLTNSNNSFTGGLTIQSGGVRFDRLNTLGLGEITLGTLNDLTLTLGYYGSSAIEFTKDLYLDGQGVIGISSETTGRLTVNNTLHFRDLTAKTLRLISGNVAAANDFQTLLTNNGAQPLTLQKAGGGLWIVSNTQNSYTGGTEIIAGILRVSDTNLNLNLANSNLRMTSTLGSVGVLEMAGEFTMGLGDGVNQVQFTHINGTGGGSGGWSAFGGPLNVTLGGDPGNTVVWGGARNASRLSLTTELQFNSALSTDVVTFKNNITLSSNSTTQSHRINVSDNTSSVTDWAVMSGEITGSGGIAKLGNGRLILTGNNTFTGGITIISGQLQGDAQTNLNLSALKLVFTNTSSSTAGILQTSGNLNFLGLGSNAGQVSWAANSSGGFAAFGGALSVTLTTDTVTPILWGATSFLNGTSEFTMNSQTANDVVTLNNSIDLGGATRVFRIYDNPDTSTDYAVIAGVLSNGGINKVGPGLLELSGANTFEGGVSITGGALRGQFVANLNLPNNTLTFRGSATTPAVLEGSGDYTASIGTGIGQVHWALVTPTNTSSFSGGWSAHGGALNVTLNNNASTPLVWDGVNSSLLGTGELQFNSGTSNNVVTFNNLIDLNDGVRTIRVQDNPDSTADRAVLTGVISSPTANLGRLIKQGEGTLVLTADSTFTGSTTIAGGTLQLGDGGTSGMLMGNIRLTTGSSTVQSYLEFNRSDVVAYGSATQLISGNSGGVIVNSPIGGGVQFNTAQTYSGSTSIQSGTLRYGIANAIPVGNRVGIDLNGTLDLNGFAAGITTINNGTLGGGVITNNGATDAVLSLTQGLFNGSIQDGATNKVSVNKLSTTTLELGGNSSYGGGTTLSAGTLIASSDTALGTGTLRLAAGTFDGGAGNRTLNVPLVLGGTATITGAGNVAFTGDSFVAAGTNLTFSNGGMLTINNLNLSNTSIYNGSSNLVFAGTLTNNGANRTMTINNSGTTTFENIRLSEAGVNRALIVWLADNANVVLAGDISNGTNTGNLTLTGSPTGSPGATILFAANNHARQISIGGVGRQVTVAAGVQVQQSSGPYFAIAGSGNTVTVEAGGLIGGAFAVSGINTIINVMGSVGNGTITLTGSGSQFTVYNGGTVGNGAIRLEDGTTFEIQAGGQVGGGAVTLVNGSTLILNGVKGNGDGSLDNGSVLRGSGQAGGNWTMNAGSTLIIGDIGSVATMTLGNLTLNGGTLRFDLGTNSDLLWLNTAGLPVINGATTINISAGAGFGIGDYTLIDGFAGTMLDLDRFNILAPVGYKKSLSSANGELILHLSLASTKIWSGSISNVWDNNATPNFTGEFYVDADNDAVEFYDGAAQADIQISAPGGLSPTSILVNNSATTYTFRGDAIVGGSQLSKRGDGLLVVLNDNTFTGGVQLSGGTIQLGNGGTTGEFDPSSIIALNNGAQLVVNRSDLIAMNGGISGTGGVVMNGSGTLQLGGINSFNGGLAVNNGTVEVVGAGLLNEFGGWTINAGATLNIAGTTPQVVDAVNVDGGVLNVNTSSVTTSAFNLNGGTVNLGSGTVAALNYNQAAGTVNVNGSNLTLSVSRFGGGLGETAILTVGSGLTLSIQNTLTYTANNNAATDPNGAIINGLGVISFSSAKALVINDSANAVNDLTIAADINLGSWVKSGAGTLYVTGNNTSASGMGLNGGSVVLGNDNALGAGTFTITTGRVLGDGVQRTVANTVLARGSFTISGTSDILFNQISNNGSLSITVDNTANTTITNLILAPSNTSSVASIRGTGNVDFYSIQAGPGTGNDSINFQGAGTYHLRGANTYLGVTSVRDGTVVVYHNDALALSSGITMGVSSGVGQNPSLLLDDGITVANNITVVNTGGSIITLGGLGSGVSTFAGNIAFSQGFQVSAAAGGTVHFTGNLDDAGSSVNGITKVGAGTVVLSGVNAYTGTTIVSAGLLQVGSATAIAPGSKLQVDSVGTFDLNGFNVAVASLFDGSGGSGAITNGGAAATFTVGGGTYAGAIGGGANVGLVKNTAGTLTLLGTSTYSGTTLVSAGSLIVDGALGATAVTVAATGTLGGDGVIGGPVEVQSGGTLNPNGSLTVGQLTVGGGALSFDLDAIGSSDQIIISGGAAPTIGAPSTLNFNTGLYFDEGTYSLINGYTGNTIDAGGFANLSAPATLSGLQVSLQNNSGSVSLVVTTPHIVWTASPTNAWGYGAGSWTGDATQFTNMAHVTFDNTAVSTDVIVDPAGVTPHHVIVNNDGSHDYTFSGGAVRGTSLTKEGVGALRLTNDHSYVRGATINGGTLVVGNGDTLGSLAVPTLVNNGTVTFERSDAYLFAGNISGVGALIQNGTGTLILAGDSSFTGPTTINNGVLQLQGNYASPIYNDSFFPSTVVSFSSGNITFTGGVNGNLSFIHNGAGTTTLVGASDLDGGTTINAGTLVVGNSLQTLNVDVNPGGTLTVAAAATMNVIAPIVVGGTANVDNVANTPGVLVANGVVNASNVVIEQGGLLKGSGTVNAPVHIQTGAGLSPGNSVESISMPQGLTLDHNSSLYFEFRDATGTTPGTDWDHIDLGTGTLTINANNRTDGERIKVYVNSLTLDGLAHGGGVSDGANFNNFNADSDLDPIQEYSWLFLSAANINVVDPFPGSVEGRFQIIDDLAGAGVFGTDNPFARPESSLGRGTFTMRQIGSNLYIHYSAIPEPGSMALAGMASLAAGWYGRRRLRKSNESSKLPTT